VEIKDKWYIKKSIQTEYNENEGEKNNQIEENYINQDNIEEEELKIFENKENETKKGENYEIKEKKDENIKYIDINDEEKIKKDKFGTEKENIFNNKKGEEDYSDDYINPGGFTYNNEYTYEKEKIIRINQKLFDEIEVTESDGINRCINKMKLLSYYSQIYIKKNAGHIAEKSYEYYDDINLPIQKLYNESIYLSQYLMYRIINSLNKKNANLNKKCVSILLDCSVYITPYKKIANMIILCAMTMVLYNLNIKYSIGLFGDEEFKIIMKQFEEEQSLLILQQVYECLMLKRYRTNLASVVWFAQKNFKFIGSYNKNNFYKNYPEQIIYIEMNRNVNQKNIELSTKLQKEQEKCIHLNNQLIKLFSFKYI